MQGVSPSQITTPDQQALLIVVPLEHSGTVWQVSFVVALCLSWAGSCRMLGTLSSNLTKNKSFMKGVALSSDAKALWRGAWYAFKFHSFQ